MKLKHFPIYNKGEIFLLLSRVEFASIERFAFKSLFEIGMEKLFARGFNVNLFGGIQLLVTRLSSLL